ncbi:MAG: hypothetical protein ACKVK8_06715 [Rhodospirillales bacterium]
MFIDLNTETAQVNAQTIDLITVQCGEAIGNSLVFAIFRAGPFKNLVELFRRHLPTARRLILVDLDHRFEG